MIQFDNIPNARELGGIHTRDGRRVRDGLLLRSAYLVHASDADIARLSEEYHISKVLDLRTGYECRRSPDRPVPGASNVNIEILSLNGHLYRGMSKFFPEGVSFEGGMAGFCMSPAAEMLCDGFYASFVSDPECQESYANFFRELLSSEGPVLWHCTQGKDRTGLAAAFLLYVLGAEEKDIHADFLESNVSYADDIAGVKACVTQMGGTQVNLECVQTLVGVSDRSFLEAMDWIGSHCGGMDEYIKNQLHLSEADVLELRRRYLV